MRRVRTGGRAVGLIAQTQSDQRNVDRTPADVHDQDVLLPSRGASVGREVLAGDGIAPGRERLDGHVRAPADRAQDVEHRGGDRLVEARVEGEDPDLAHHGPQLVPSRQRCHRRIGEDHVDELTADQVEFCPEVLEVAVGAVGEVVQGTGHQLVEGRAVGRPELAGCTPPELLLQPAVGDRFPQLPVRLRSAAQSEAPGVLLVGVPHDARQFVVGPALQVRAVIAQGVQRWHSECFPVTPGQLRGEVPAHFRCAVHTSPLQLGDHGVESSAVPVPGAQPFCRPHPFDPPRHRGQLVGHAAPELAPRDPQTAASRRFLVEQVGERVGELVPLDRRQRWVGRLLRVPHRHRGGGRAQVEGGPSAVARSDAVSGPHSAGFRFRSRMLRVTQVFGRG